MEVKITELDISHVKQYLRIEHDEDNHLLLTMLSASKNYVQNYIGADFNELQNIPAEFTMAALNLISHWYENRAIHIDKDTKASELAYVFSGLLDMHRANL
ncbi:head-tail connector protein [Edaphobacillus lindanitolerans]|uniref:Uncharacterized phage protein (Possible DNA packaging) n=1 Tax=Edaphobacillus lindanitolerans TaxID=550447 RepID=A0A1U7PQ10_9BACI|nr:head-tail connector protein [Edaphobacillus lindanitolerans]SIT90639.1 uncharacterized phage protein (possible DNA packaging) [Edaphobacillus lindanitolerans]